MTKLSNGRAATVLHGPNLAAVLPAAISWLGKSEQETQATDTQEQGTLTYFQ